MAYPDVVALLVTYLEAAIPGRPIHVDIPRDRPNRFVQVRRIGGTATPPVRDMPNVDVKAWAQTAEQAMSDLLVIRGLIWALSGTAALGVTVYRVAEMMGPRSDNDPETSQPFAMFTPSLTIRADDAAQQFG